MAQSTIYPKIYQYGPIAKALWGLLACLTIIGGLMLSACWLFMPDMEVTLSGLGVAAYGAVRLMIVLRGKIVLYEDRLEYVGVLATRRLNSQVIKATREWSVSLGEFTIELILKSGRSVTIRDFGKMDHVLLAWLKTFEQLS